MSFVTDDGDRITEADHAAAIVEGRGETNYAGSSKVISIRLPSDIVVRAQAMAHKSGKTRNAMMCTLLEVGLEEVRQRLAPETLQTLHEIEQELFRDEYSSAQSVEEA